MSIGTETEATEMAVTETEATEMALAEMAVTEMEAKMVVVLATTVI